MLLSISASGISKAKASVDSLQECTLWGVWLSISGNPRNNFTCVKKSHLHSCCLLGMAGSFRITDVQGDGVNVQITVCNKAEMWGRTPEYWDDHLNQLLDSLILQFWYELLTLSLLKFSCMELPIPLIIIVTLVFFRSLMSSFVFRVSPTFLLQVISVDKFSVFSLFPVLQHIGSNWDSLFGDPGCWLQFYSYECLSKVVLLVGTHVRCGLIVTNAWSRFGTTIM